MREEIRERGRRIKAFAVLEYGDVKKMCGALGLNNLSVYAFIQGHPGMRKLSNKIANDMQSKGYDDYAKMVRG